MASAAVAAAPMALVPAFVLAFNLPPSATIFNQVAAMVGWGAFLLVWNAFAPRHRMHPGKGALAYFLAVAILLGATLTAPVWRPLPWALGLSIAGTLTAALLVSAAAFAIVATGFGRDAFRSLCIGLIAAGFISAAIGLVQVYVPQWTDGQWISPTSVPGRAVGNLRQPNHLSSLLLWSIVAAIWYAEDRCATAAGTAGRNGRQLFALLTVMLFLYVVVLSGSRTGALGTLTLALWGLLDRRLSRNARILLATAPLVYALMWFGAAEWARHTQTVFGLEGRFTLKGDYSSARYAIWSNTLDMIAAQPWWGVGLGEYNFAWTLTPFAHRPHEFYDHAHNLPLHLAAELGLPLAAVTLGLLLWALLQATRTAIDSGRRDGVVSSPFQRAALVIVILVSVHSMLEYPLWYSYFLLPTAFALGLCLAAPHSGEIETPRWRRSPGPADSSLRHRLHAADPRRDADALRLPARGADLFAFGAGRAAFATHRRGPGELVLLAARGLRRRHHGSAAVVGDGGIQAGDPLPSRCPADDRVGHGSRRSR